MTGWSQHVHGGSCLVIHCCLHRELCDDEEVSPEIQNFERMRPWWNDVIMTLFNGIPPVGILKGCRQRYSVNKPFN